ncbi:DUF1622 domain-containing protein [Stenomitos frigidus]|uniref:DUF1622 domain-containing protein n=1 Tax=Stenomitos frigidus ULC18 TaxID=2107698 RepID=A0A2T1EN19_9CYAN|nr:DUF1622 domain-containing protein [Stenomitos frigidus]PSB34105.1 hypothetical protein C7B82_03145 [Stenomitos frigidus ULC18]
MAIAFGWLTILQHSILLELAAETTVSPTLGLTRSSESFLQEFALFLKIVLEFIAILIIAVSLVVALQKLIRQKQKRFQSTQQAIRLELGISLALSLEFLLAADIVSTAVSPSWDAIARLAAITGIRTFLNFFLQKEVKELQAMDQRLLQQKHELNAQENG